RVPKMVAGDINAEVVGVRTGAAAFLRLVERYGLETFWACVERMFDHGEAVVRSYFERIPDGRYVGHGQVDDNGITSDPVAFEGGRLPRSVRGAARRGPGVQRRRHLRARLVGRPRAERRALGGRLPDTGRPGRLGPPRRRVQPDPPRRGGDSLLADRGVGVEEP